MPRAKVGSTCWPLPLPVCWCSNRPLVSYIATIQGPTMPVIQSFPSAVRTPDRLVTDPSRPTVLSEDPKVTAVYVGLDTSLNTEPASVPMHDPLVVLSTPCHAVPSHEDTTTHAQSLRPLLVASSQKSSTRASSVSAARVRVECPSWFTDRSPGFRAVVFANVALMNSAVYSLFWSLLLLLTIRRHCPFFPTGNTKAFSPTFVTGPSTWLLGDPLVDVAVRKRVSRSFSWVRMIPLSRVSTPATDMGPTRSHRRRNCSSANHGRP